MQKLFTPKAFLLFTLLFICVAAASFIAFRETDQVRTSVKQCCQLVQPAKNSHLLWEVVSRQFLSLVSI